MTNPLRKLVPAPQGAGATGTAVAAERPGGLSRRLHDLLHANATLGPLFVLANVAVFVVFVPTPIAIDYASLGRASLGVLLGVFLTLPQVLPAFGARAQLVKSSFVLWSLPVWVVLGILLHLLGPKYVW